ncbi:hypothetical protein SAVIM338S_00204 [Streptomyces avidinii]
MTIGAGLGLRAVATGSAAKYGGDALYTVLILALVVLAAPRLRPVRAAAVALAFSWLVEFLQLTAVPAELSRHSTVARLVLGSTFNPPDLFWYAVGAAAGWLVHANGSVKSNNRPPFVHGRTRPVRRIVTDTHHRHQEERAPCTSRQKRMPPDPDAGP